MREMMINPRNQLDCFTIFAFVKYSRYSMRIAAAIIYLLLRAIPLLH